MTDVRDLHVRWMRDSNYRDAYEASAPEHALARELIHARVKAGLTQEQVAERMHTTQSVVARLESGKAKPSTRTLEKFAAATGTHVLISLKPVTA